MIVSLVVTGDEAGLIKFYDTQLKILYWYENSQLSAIRSVAFDFDAKQIEIRDPTDFEMGMSNIFLKRYLIAVNLHFNQMTS